MVDPRRSSIAFTLSILRKAVKMPPFFSFRDAKSLISRYRVLRENATLAKGTIEWHKSEIIKSAKALVEFETRNKLPNISIEELSKRTKGVRIAALRNAGFCSAADVLSVDPYALTAIDGVGQKTAFAISRAASLLAQEVRDATFVSLSLDRKNIYSDALACSIYALLRCREIKRSLINERSAFLEQQIDDALRNLSAAANPIRWALLSRSKKKQVEEAYSFLVDSYMGDYGRVLQSLSLLTNTRFQTDEAAAWNNFASNPYAYIEVLESLVPECMASEEYDDLLPRDVVRGIEDEEPDFGGLNCSLRRYQIWAVKFAMHQKRFILGDEMGLGKTVQAIAVAVALQNVGAGMFLVVCPASVLENWCREVSFKSNLECLKLYGDVFRRNAIRWVETGGIAVTTYESLKKLSLPDGFRIDLLVVDEAHYIKHKTSQRSARVRNLCLQSERVILMTGTALENNVEEMVSLIDSIRPDIALKAQNKPSNTFRKTVAPVYLRRRRKDVLSELPQLIEQKEWCSLSKNELLLYENAVEKRDITMMRRVSWCIENLSESSKANRAKEIVEQACEEGRKTIIFSFYLKTLFQVCTLFDGVCFGPITGSIPPRERQQIIDDFNNASNGAVLVSQVQAGGVGLNIQSASVVILCEPQLKPSTENQAISRAYRMGQARNVLVYRLLATDSIDERIDTLLWLKKREFEEYADCSDSSDESFELNDSLLNGLIEDEVERIRTIRKVGGSKAARYALESEGVGCSVSERAKKTPQPNDGYLSPRMMNKTKMAEDFSDIKQGENISPGLIGMVVDYLSRFMLGEPVEKAFSVSLMGAHMAKDEDNAKRLIADIKGLDSRSIVNAVKMTGYDVCVRAGLAKYKPVELIDPNETSIENIRIMVNRTISHFQKYGGITKSMLTFPGGYTEVVTSGDGDYLTHDALWDMKTSKKSISKVDTLQLLIYWRLGIHSVDDEYQSVKYLGVCNPRRNEVYLVSVSDLPRDLISEVDAVVIGYEG